MAAEGIAANGSKVVDLEVGTDKLPYGWSTGINDDGLVYYKNNITREIQYEVPTQRARPKPKEQKKSKTEGQTASGAAPKKKPRPKHIPSASSRRCIAQCVGVAYFKEYNEEYSNFNNKSSNCKSFCCSIGFNTISILINGGCMLILLPWAILMDIINIFIAFFLYIPPCCCGCCMYWSEQRNVGFCCLGTCLLRSSLGFCCYEEGEFNFERLCMCGQADTNMYASSY